MRKEAYFGPAGGSEDFYAEGHKSSLEMPAWLSQKGLSAYEYQCSKGVKISEDAAKKLGINAKENDITLSVHAPYYISLSSVDEEKRLKSVEYILNTLRAANAMGAERIVVHSGSCAKITRREALMLAKDTLKRALYAAKEAGYAEIRICPETMGKVNQLGNVAEVCELCSVDESLIPAIDFGHVNAQTLGGLREKADFEEVFNLVQRKLGEYRVKNLHMHYSRIEFTNCGEKKHHTYAETEYGPEFAPIAEIIAERGYTPTVICESSGTQTADSVILKRLYESYRSELK